MEVRTEGGEWFAIRKVEVADCGPVKMRATRTVFAIRIGGCAVIREPWFVTGEEQGRLRRSSRDWAGQRFEVKSVGGPGCGNVQRLALNLNARQLWRRWHPLSSLPTALAVRLRPVVSAASPISASKSHLAQRPLPALCRFRARNKNDAC